MRPSETPSRDWIDDRIEAYLDGELPAGEHAAFEQALRRDEASGWDAELFLARRIRDELRALPRPACPPHVAEAVLTRTRRPVQALRPGRLRDWIERQTRAWWQPALAMTMLLALVLSAALFGPPAKPAPSAEVERARAQVEWTLAYLSEVGRQTGKAVRRDAIEERLLGPVQDAFGARSRQPNETQR